MKIKMPKINKTTINPEVEYKDISYAVQSSDNNVLLSDNYDCDYDCYDCGNCDCDCDDCNCDCDYDCGDCNDCDCNGYLDDDDEWHSFDCADCVCSDCDCYDCDCYDCDCSDCIRNTSSTNYNNSNKSPGIIGTYYVIGVRFLGVSYGCYYYLCKDNDYYVGDTLTVPTSQGNKQATVIFKKTYYNTKDLPYEYSKMKYAPPKNRVELPSASTTYTNSTNYNNSSSSDLYDFIYSHPIFCLIVIVILIIILGTVCSC